MIVSKGTNPIDFRKIFAMEVINSLKYGGINNDEDAVDRYYFDYGNDISKRLWWTDYANQSDILFSRSDY